MGNLYKKEMTTVNISTDFGTKHNFCASYKFSICHLLRGLFVTKDINFYLNFSDVEEAVEEFEYV